jgi:hypothetical protein
VVQVAAKSAHLELCCFSFRLLRCELLFRLSLQHIHLSCSDAAPRSKALSCAQVCMLKNVLKESIEIVQ